MTIRAADYLFLADEPSSVGYHAAAELREAGLVCEGVAMQSATPQVLAALRSSPSDAIALYSPFQYSHFMRETKAALRELGKPIICYVSERTVENPFPGYRQFHEEHDWADYYACADAVDVEWFRSRGAKAGHFPLFVATSLFKPALPWADRIKKFCFVGHVNDYVPGMYAERRRILAALTERGLVDVLNIPRHVSTAPAVARAFGTYAGVLCPPSNGVGHSVRVYEASAAGAMVLECQPLDPRNVWFMSGRHRLEAREGMPDEWWQGMVAAQPWHGDNADVAERGMRHCRDNFSAAEVWRGIFAEAGRAVG